MPLTENERSWLETVAQEHRDTALRAREVWNAEADQFNQWSELSKSERDQALMKEIERDGHPCP